MTKVAKRLKKEIASEINLKSGREIHLQQKHRKTPEGNIPVTATVGYEKDDSYVQADYFGTKFIAEAKYDVITTPEGKLVSIEKKQES